jgi:Flp pilus assembly protein TadB
MFIFAMENYSIHKRRLRQLSYNKKKKEADMTDLIDKVTKPIISHIFLRMKPMDLEELGEKLRMAKWDKYFTPQQFRALNWVLRGIGIFFFLLVFNSNKTFALVWLIVPSFILSFMMNNNIKNRRDKLVADFPEFIRIVEGYLSANMPFSKAIESSIKYVGDEWKPILQNFVVETDTKSIGEALDTLKNTVDLFEVREFVSLVKLNLEQGGDTMASFEAQAEKIREMQLNMIAMKIGRRKIYGTMLQGPLLLVNMMVFALPIVPSFSGMNL